MAKSTRLTDMVKQSKNYIQHLQERQVEVQENIDLIDAEIAVKQSAKKELVKQVNALENDIKEEQQVLEKLEA